MPRIVALDVGTSAVKATVWITSGRRYELEGRYVEPVPRPEVGEPGTEERLDALAALVAQHREWQNPANRIGAVWPVAQGTIRRMSLPFTDRAQVEKTLPFAVEAEVPFDLDQMVLAWRTLPAEGRTDAIVGLVRHDDLAGFLRGLSEQQVDPAVVHFDAELLTTWAPRDRTVAVVDVGHRSTVVTVVIDGALATSHGITLGGRDFTAAIARADGSSFAEAEETKHALSQRTGLPGPADDEATDGGAPRRALTPAARQAVDEAMGLLLAEIRSSLIAAEDALGREIEEVILVGGGGRLDPFETYLAQDLGLVVRRPEGTDGMPVGPGFALADALALRLSGEVPGKAIDLRVGDLEFRGGVDLLRVALTYGTGGLGVFLVAALAVFGVRYHSLSSELEETEQAYRAIVTENFPTVSAGTVRDGSIARAIMQEKLEEARARAAVLGDPAGRPPPTVDAVHALTAALPPANQVTLDVSDLTIATAAITFRAETDGYASVGAIEEALQATPRFRNAATRDPKKVRDKVQFQVNIPLGGAGAPEEG